MKRRAILAIAASIAVLAVGVLTIPQPLTPSTETTGDAALIDRVRESLPAGPFDTLSVAVIDGDDITTAHFGADDDTEYEIGSVTKTFTGSLYPIALERGEVQTDSTLGEVLGVTGAAASVTLEELATQHSGLPRLPASAAMTARSVLSNFSGSDPYSGDVAELVSLASASGVDESKPFLYSNFGMALLGQALAVAADTDYASLVRERIADELGLASTYAPSGPLEADATTGFAASGRQSDPWTLAAYGPAGSIRSTLADMTDYVLAQRDDTAPGVEATQPRVNASETARIGYAWFTSDDGITWHNGMTGGFASFVAFDRSTDRAVVILSNSAVNVDDLGFDLMEDQ